MLVIEDDVDLREILDVALQNEDYQVVTATNGPEAIKMAEKTVFDLVITDVRLGKMDGVECLLELRRHQPHLRAIVITGYASDNVPQRAIEADVDDYIYKPFGLNSLLNCVQNAVREKSAEVAKERALRAFYVGVRSKKLSQEGAAQVWEGLSKQGNYEQLTQTVLNYVKQDPAPSPSGVDWTTFQGIYEKIQQGESPAELLELQSP